ncbi:MAG: leucine-rich repeat domain-containing protein [Spirochaetia bacterium]|nr:leucine-rich repeat domain-containing protein [Spirochaetia bacterium]
MKRGIFLIVIILAACKGGGSSNSSAWVLLGLSPSGTASSGNSTAPPSPLPEIFPAPEPPPTLPPTQPPVTPGQPSPPTVTACTPSAELKITDITFVDANLAACIKNTGLVYARDVTSLTCVNWVKSVAGVECLSSLKKLDVSNNPITDLLPIAALTGLEELRLGWMLADVDLALLAPLVHLKSLNVSHISGFDRLPMENFPEMERFTAAYSSLTNTSAARICTMRKIKYLNLYNNQLSDVSFLADCPYLEELDLTENLLIDAGQFGSLTSLKKLTLWGNQIVTLQGISGASSLEYLVLAYNRLTSVEGLGGLQKLSALEISYNQIGSLDPLADLKNLESLGAGDNPFESLSPLGHLKKLKSLGLVSNYKLKLTTMPEIPSLKTLCIGATGRIDSIHKRIRAGS